MPKTTNTTKKVTKTAVKAAVKPKVVTIKKVASGFSLPTFSVTGEAKAESAVPKLMEKAVANAQILQAIRVYQTNLRQGTASTKTRGEVTGSTRKIYRQKGTGRARHGAITAPIFVGGGITFGPKPRHFELSLPQKMRRQAFASVLSDRIKDKAVSVLSGVDKISGKTRDMHKFLEKTNLLDKKVLFVFGPKMKKAIQATRNLPLVTLRTAESLSLLDLLTHEHVIAAEDAAKALWLRLEAGMKKSV
ncbi:TPA: 50S ribosomal protein L4 [Patescibacteria group bacterium]|uniref:Large ribosomal subunit protein uL4 n=1 Tax=Candidatus Gottesmanbacteria bacterium GW2011_GWA1_43_11 TaxID=1618436 RepID=A0A0G1FCR3_9BACT|nr:MAG: 50S ribosomal protein L4 [Candidatus Gottesmanbacteria bacterium GW2011_GWA1_43_11]HCS78453.1 50S ribosomal protein L4 [Patescibacteria group bacterium]